MKHFLHSFIIFSRDSVISVTGMPDAPQSRVTSSKSQSNMHSIQSTEATPHLAVAPEAAQVIASPKLRAAWVNANELQTRLEAWDLSDFILIFGKAKVELSFQITATIASKIFFCRSKNPTSINFAKSGTSDNQSTSLNSAATRACCSNT